MSKERKDLYDQSTILIATGRDFCFDLSLSYLSRSADERLHLVYGKGVNKLVPCPSGPIVIRVEALPNADLQISGQSAYFQKGDVPFLTDYVKCWLGLDTDLRLYYQHLADDSVMGPILRLFRGLRVVGIIDLFEAISWSIIGQQINLTFAYQVKRRLVETVGESLEFDGHRYYLFSSPEQILSLDDEQFRAMKFSKQKIRYIRLAADQIASGRWSKSTLDRLPTKELIAELTTLTGIGEWSANYVALRCFHRYDAIPLGDAGIHQALKKHLNLDRKPSRSELETLKDQWHPWGGLVTYYLWSSLS